MTKREIAALICKALSIYVFVITLNQLPLLFASALYSMLNNSTDTPMEKVSFLASILAALPLTLNILAGLFLWMGADNLARRMVKNDDTTVQPIIGQEAQTIVFSALGLFTLLQAIPRAGQMITNFYTFSRQDALMQREFTGSSTPDIAGLLIQLALGVWLLFGASGLSKLLRSFHTVGLDKQSSVSLDKP